MLRILLLAAVAAASTTGAAAQADAVADSVDALVRGSYQAVLDGPAFRFAVALRVEADDTTFTQAGVATTYALPPEGLLLHRIEFDEGDVTAEAFDGDVFTAAYPRTRKVYVDSTGAGMQEGTGVFLRLHPALGMALYNLYARADEVEVLGGRTVGGRPCHAVAFALGGETPLDVTACFDGSTRLPLRVTVDVGREGGVFEVTYGVAEAIEVPPAGTFRVALPDGYAFAPYDGSAQPRLAVGEAAPEFEVTGDTGEVLRLSDYRGRVVLLDFWGTWCAPCVEALPGLGELAAALPELTVLGLAAYEEPDADPVAFARSHGAGYAVARVPESVVEAYLVRAFPTYYVIGPDGTILFEGVPDEDETVEARLGAFLRSVLALR